MMRAHIRLVGAGFVAELDDGRRIECTDLLDLPANCTLPA